MMHFWLLGFGFSAIVACVAFVAGWWLRGLRLVNRSAGPTRPRADSRSFAEQALAGLHAATETVRSCVEQHTECIRAIEAELRESSASEPAVIISAADSIRAANGLVQHQFNDIQKLLDCKQVELHDHLADPYGLLCTFASLDRQKHVYRQVLNSLELLAVELMTHVAGHGQRLKNISNGLETDAKSKLPDVASAVTQILDAAADMEKKITSTESRIDQQAEKVQMQAVLSNVDLLTSLPNRRAFDAELQQSAARSRGTSAYFTVMFIDLDGFNRINTQYGHHGGDVILRQAASVLKGRMRGKDLVARYKGDTYAILLGQTTLHDSLPVAEQLRALLGETQFSHGNYPLRLTASVGVAQLQPEETGEEVAQRANAALTSAKQAGGNVSYWHDGKESFPVSSAFRASGENGATPSLVTMFRRSVTGGDADESAETEQRTAGGPVLTGRSLFVANLQRRLSEWKRGGPPVAVIVLRVDQLDELESRCGAEAETFLLGVLSRLLEAATRDMDERCEFQDGQFALLLPGLDTANAMAVAERLQSQIRECKVRMGNDLWNITASIGLANASDSSTVVDVMQSAESAMKRASERGGDTIVLGDAAAEFASVAAK